MLDKRCIEILKILSNSCEGSNYKIFEISELAEKVPSAFNVNNDEIKECLQKLYEREYLSIKYQDDAQVCLSVLFKGRLFSENKSDEDDRYNLCKRKYFSRAFWGAVVGGIVGGTICFFLHFLINLIGG